MRVFVAGATGIAGRRAVLRLIEAGHQVTGVARSAEKAAELADAGASAARVSLFDRSDLFSDADALPNLVASLGLQHPILDPGGNTRDDGPGVLPLELGPATWRTVSATMPPTCSPGVAPSGT